MARIYVVGSLNADLVISAPRLPVAGETLAGGDLRIFPGGKGGNQAVAAAKLGVSVRMAGAVGRDPFGDLLLESLRDAGVDATSVSRVDRSTGVALITVLPNADNAIVISPGANAALTPAAVHDALAEMAAGDVLLCQLETPLEVVRTALEFARGRGVVSVLDPAPAQPLDDSFLALPSLLTPNETEAVALLGVDASEGVYGIDEIAERLQARSGGPIVLKLGEKGCLIKAPRTPGVLLEGFQVEAVDTTAAGDTFNGALAASLLGGADLAAAASLANAAAAVSVTRAGAQSSAPSLDEVDKLLEHA